MAASERGPEVTQMNFLAGKLGLERTQIAEWILGQGYRYSEEPFELSSGGLSHDFIDAKLAIADGWRLKIVGQTVANVALSANIEFDSVGGLTMGADSITHATSMVTEKKWFTVRKQPKGRGTNQLIEGAVPDADTTVLIVDDVTTTGNSLLKAVEAVRKTRADVVMAIALVDRGPLTALKMQEEGIPYEPIVTFEDLGIEPIGER